MAETDGEPFQALSNKSLRNKEPPVKTQCLLPVATLFPEAGEAVIACGGQLAPAPVSQILVSTLL